MEACPTSHRTPPYTSCDSSSGLEATRRGIFMFSTCSRAFHRKASPQPSQRRSWHCWGLENYANPVRAARCQQTTRALLDFGNGLLSTFEPSLLRMKRWVTAVVETSGCWWFVAWPRFHAFLYTKCIGLSMFGGPFLSFEKVRRISCCEA